MTGRIVDAYTNISTVKLFSHSQREEDYAKEAMEEFLPTAYRQMRPRDSAQHRALSAQHRAAGERSSASASGCGCGNLVTPGAIAVAAALVLRFFGMSQWIMWEISALFENVGAVRTGITAFSVPRTVVDRPDAAVLPPAKGDIRFDNVTLPLRQGKGGVIEDLDLHIRPGEKIGLVGRSGAGKSTIVNLLLRFYDVEAGRILIDGTDIAAVTQDSLRANIGVVTQDTSLLHRSVRDNIAYGRPDASDDEMIAAAAKLPRRTTSSPGWPTRRAGAAMTRMSASAASSSRAASASASPSPACC